MKRHITKPVQSITLFLFIFCFLTNVNAQNIAIEQDGACINCSDLTADPSAALEVRATDRGILIPRLADTSAVANPAVGLMIYDNSANAFQYYDSTAWKKIGKVEHISFPAVENTFVGVNAGPPNAVGSENNTAVGFGALSTNYTFDNTAVGCFALHSNTFGEKNTAIGCSALFSNTTGRNNIAVGFDALRDNTIGKNNIAVGFSTLRYNTTGYENTVIGNFSMKDNTTGFSNIASGYFALSRNTTGAFNTAYGYEALNNNVTGLLNTAIGYSAFLNGTDYNNSTAIGYQAQPTASNQVRLGNNGVTSIGGYTNWSNVSDARFKKQVQSDVPGLAFINLLNPVTYQMDMDAIAKHHHTPDSLRLAESERAKAAIRYTGFLAQEVEKAAELIDYDFSGVDAPQHERDNYSLRYAEFVVPLVKAVQELDEKNGALILENEKLAKAIELLKAEKDAEITDLEARLGKIEALLRQRVE